MVPKVDVDGWRVYGRWAGNPKGTREDPTRCVEEVCSGGREMTFYQCLRKRGHGPGGLYCKQHDPAAVKRRLAESSKKFDAEMVVRQKQWLAEELGRLLMDAGYDTEEKVKALIPMGVAVPLKRLFQVTHSHRHGMSTYLVMADSEPSEEALIKALEIDFEPEREETLEVEEVTQITEL